MKPAYVSVECRHDNTENTFTIEGWITLDTKAPNIEGQSKFLLICPSLDYDEDTMKIGVHFKDIVSIMPAQSIREYKTYNAPYAQVYAVDSNGITRAVHPDELRATNLGQKR